MEKPAFTVHKLDHGGREVLSYPAVPVFRTPSAVLVKALWGRSPLDTGYVVLEPGDQWLEAFYADRWYNVFEIRSADGRLKGRYCNITRPAQISADAVCAEDLALDVWITPDGEARVLDEEEFARAPLPDHEANGGGSRAGGHPEGTPSPAGRTRRRRPSSGTCCGSGA